jgi:hypothetical protein
MESQVRTDENYSFCDRETDDNKKHKPERKEDIGGSSYQKNIKMTITTIPFPSQYKCYNNAQLLKKMGWMLILSSIFTLLFGAIVYLSDSFLFMALGMTIGMIAIFVSQKMQNAKMDHYSYTHRVQE